MKTFSRLVAALILCSVTRPVPSHAGDYQGADAVLRQVAALVAKNAGGATPSPADPVRQWRERPPRLPRAYPRAAARGGRWTMAGPF